MKKCYICLPINGKVDTVFDRAKIAKDFVEDYLGMKAIVPMDINEETKEILNDSERPIHIFMGKDIEVLIGECDAIYICDGWENSKGCNVEIECAKQYNKEIFWQTIPKTLSFNEVIKYKENEIYQHYRYLNAKHGPGSFQVSVYKKEIDWIKDIKEKF